MISLEDKIELLTLAHERHKNGYATAARFYHHATFNLYPEATANNTVVTVRIEGDCDPDPTYSYYRDNTFKQVQVGKASVELVKELMKYGHFDTDSIIAFLKSQGCRKARNYE